LHGEDGTISNRADTRRIALATPSGFLAFGLGSGLSPFAPGTAGTIAALLPGALLVQLPFWPALAVVVAAFLLGIYLCGVTGRALGVHDHGGIVWDEFVGLWLVLLFVPFHWAWWLAAFVLFRLFDILKPWPIRWLDRRVHGGFGVMIDDILAAVYALALLLPARIILG
jgi:phosphatidylglycerophosphatase A